MRSSDVLTLLAVLAGVLVLGLGPDLASDRLTTALLALGLASTAAGVRELARSSAPAS